MSEKKAVVQRVVIHELLDAGVVAIEGRDLVFESPWDKGSEAMIALMKKGLVKDVVRDRE